MFDDLEARPRPTVLVVDAEPAMRRLLRLGLEVDGALVIEAGSVDQARRVLADDFVGRRVGGVVVSAALMGAGANTLADDLKCGYPSAAFVILTEPGELPLSSVGKGVERGDLAGLLRALALPDSSDSQELTAAGLLRERAAAIAQEWIDLCQWDPMLPPDSRPALAVAFVGAVADAARRPQPLGWGPDSAIEAMAKRFADADPGGGVEVVIGQLICLREALWRALSGTVPADELAETHARIDMLLDRSIQIAALHRADQLKREAFLDPLTGLLNRRGLERDLRMEVGRASRYGRRFSVMVIDLDGLKEVNDQEGHGAGDERLRALANAAVEALRAGDSAYRVGGDEFVLLLPEVGAVSDTLATRIFEAGAPPFSWGMATFPDESDDLLGLLDLADRRLFDQRRDRRRQRHSG